MGLFGVSGGVGGLGVETEESFSLVDESGADSVVSLSIGESMVGGVSLEAWEEFFLPQAKSGKKEKASASAAKARIFIIKNLRYCLLRSLKKREFIISVKGVQGQ